MNTILRFTGPMLIVALLTGCSGRESTVEVAKPMAADSLVSNIKQRPVNEDLVDVALMAYEAMAQFARTDSTARIATEQ